MEAVQRSLEWHEQRLGKFSASEIYKLMGVRGLGETGKNYAFDKAVETLYGQTEDNFVSYDMQRGIDLEPLAFAKFTEIMSEDFINVSECGFFDCGTFGASPDGLVGTDAVLEIKCPTATTFFKLVATNEIKDQYLYQMQLQMIATNTNKAYFFNYFVLDGQEFWHKIEIDRDESICEKMLDRIKEANEIKENYINQLKLKQQW